MKFTADMDARIVGLYTPPYVRGAIVQQAKDWGLKVEFISRRARELRLQPLSNVRGSRQWTIHEILLLRSVPHKNNREASRFLTKKGYPRSRDACSSFRLRDGWRASVERDPSDIGYSANAVAELLGINQGTIVRSIRMGHLKAKQAENGIYRILAKDLYDFMVQHVHRWEPAKCDKYWLVDFLTNDRAMR